MSFGRIGTIRALILCGMAAALASGSSPALARHHHRHHHRRQLSAKHETPAQPGASTEQAGAKAPASATVTGTAAAGAAAGAAGAAGVELVPGPLPLPTQASSEKNVSSPAPANAPAPAKAPPAPPAKDQSGEASPAELPTPVAAHITIAPTPVAARSAIDTAVAKLFLGEPVYGARGEPMGDLARIFPGPDGQVKSVVITWGGLFGYFRSHRTIEWPNAAPSIQGGKLVLQGLTKAALQSTQTR